MVEMRDRDGSDTFKETTIAIHRCILMFNKTILSLIAHIMSSNITSCADNLTHVIFFLSSSSCHLPLSLHSINRHLSIHLSFKHIYSQSASKYYVIPF